MKQEISSACQYWADRLDYSTPHSIKQTFMHNLSILLFNKFKGHWYVDTPHRGQALREMLFDPANQFVDSLLIEAALASGFDFSHACHDSRGVRMWVDPGEVEVSFTDSPSRRKVIYQQQSRSSSPPTFIETNQYVPVDDGTMYYYPESYYPQDCYQYNDDPYLYSNENQSYMYSNENMYYPSHMYQPQMVETL